MCGTLTHKRWLGMRRRCTDKNDAGYENYGAKGIIACKGLLDFPVFHQHLGECPSDKHTVDRIESTGSYTCGGCEECLANSWPANVRWATMKEQNRNKKSNRMITANGVTKCLQDWAEELGVKP